MTVYDKPKRKPKTVPQASIWEILSALVSGIIYYTIVAPSRWLERQTSRFAGWSWHQTKRFTRWIWQQTGAGLSWTWRTSGTILQKTILAPIIGLGRLLGFVPRAIPDGLSPAEIEAYQRINQAYRRRKLWYLHLLIFSIGMAILWVGEFFYYPPRTGMAIMFTMIWLIALGGHRLWMNLGESEDREIGDALQQLRDTQQTIYYEEEYYHDTSHLEDHDEADWVDERVVHLPKAKRQSR